MGNMNSSNTLSAAGFTNSAIGNCRGLSTSAEVAKLAAKPATPVSLKTLVDTGQGKFLKKGDPATKKTLQVAQFMHREMPVRFAHRVKELDELPYGLSDMASIQVMKGWYEQGLADIIKCPLPQDEATEQQFFEVADHIYNRHNETLMQVAKGLFEFKSSGQAQSALKEHQAKQKTRKGGKWAARTGFKKDESGGGGGKWSGHGIGTELADIPEIHEHLDKFLMHRLGIRVVLGQYLALKPDGDEDVHRHIGAVNSMSESDEVGLIKLRVSPTDMANAAYEDARSIFERQFPEFDCPELIIQGNQSAEIAYVPHHLYYILFELIKNSFQATAQHHGVRLGQEELPPVRVTIGDSIENEDIVIKVSDEGGGIPRSHTKRIFSYLFTTAEPVFNIETADDLESFGRNSPLAGLGYGLPIARLYARYFGGDLHIISVEGFGTDAFLYLHKIGDHEEPLA